MHNKSIKQLLLFPLLTFDMEYLIIVITAGLFRAFVVAKKVFGSFYLCDAAMEGNRCQVIVSRKKNRMKKLSQVLHMSMTVLVSPKHCNN